MKCLSLGMVLARRFLTTLTIIVIYQGLALAQYKPPQVLNDPNYDHDKLLRFGFSLGANFMDFRVNTNKNFDENTDRLFADISNLIPGFNVNVVSDLRIFPTLHLRFMPGLAFGQRNLSFYNYDGTLNTMMKMESSFIETPLTFKYSAERKTNARPYVVAGANFRIDMAAYKKLNIEEGVFLRLTKGDFYYEFGVGCDFFLTYFKFSPEIKFSSGFLNVLAREKSDEGGEIYMDAIRGMQSQVIVIAFHFE